MERSEFEELSAGHALGALSAADEFAFRGQLVAHPEWDDIARRDEDTVTALAESVPVVAPPAGALTALLARIHEPRAEASVDPLPALLEEARSTPGPLPTEAVQTVARRSWTRGILALAASVVVLAVIGFGSAWLGGQINPQNPVNVALEQIERSSDAQSATVDVNGGGSATAYWSASLGQAVLVTDGVAQLDDAQTYEMWLVRDGTTLAAGLFQVGTDGDARSIVAGALERGDSIAISVEPSGGALGTSPTSDPVVVIPTGAV